MIPPRGYKADPFADVRSNKSLFDMKPGDWLVRDKVEPVPEITREQLEDSLAAIQAFNETRILSISVCDLVSFRRELEKGGRYEVSDPKSKSMFMAGIEIKENWTLPSDTIALDYPDKVVLYFINSGNTAEFPKPDYMRPTL